MTALRHTLRLLPLGLAALASVATGMSDPGRLAIDSVSPFDGETAVAAEVTPRVIFSHPDDTPEPEESWLRLSRADGTPVPGHVESSGFGTYNPSLVYLPDEPLASGDYILVVDHGGTIVDIVDGEKQTRAVYSFSTRSAPRILARGSEPSSPTWFISLSQAVDEASLLEHAVALDATGDPLTVTRVIRDAGVLSSYTYSFVVPFGTVDLSLADGVLAADGTPVPGLPILFSEPSL